MDANIYSQLIKNIELQFRKKLKKHPYSKGMIVTISREYGSGVRDVGEKLVQKLNDQKIGFNLNDQPWKLIDTTVIHDLSEKLKVSYKDIEEYVPFEKKGFVEQLIHSFGKNYNKLDGHLTSALEAIMHTYFERGNVVILGRGGGHFASMLKNALRIKINSTYQFRVAEIMKNHNLNYNDAKLKMLEFSKLRNDFLEHVQKGNSETYDTVIDRTRLDDDTLADYLLSFTSAKAKDLSRLNKAAQLEKV
ncbi:AAA family ATPase [Flammeovirga sp. SJP92]|uniref:cytidylate kinase-like family protein n=1 Tax=Flammeovirga sp. SJP92 TaxID=1775430 RepID=UPI000788694D|nr:cytidylate kinase-like family protein [Flammeovirga sp. SJP92]KXX71634.1 hypothetical protein AVL50_05005 [Flammeovirga sp. SJP92]